MKNLPVKRFLSIIAFVCIAAFFHETGRASELLRNVNSSAGGSDYSVFFDDSYGKSNYTVQKGGWCEASTLSAYTGEKSLRMVIKNSTDEPRIYFGMSYKLARCVDFKKTALSFKYNPQFKREQTYVGILSQCVSNNASPVNRGIVSMMKISLTDYLGLTEKDVQNGWINVTIPLEYFMKNGEFDAFTGSDDVFSKHTLCGMAFEFLTEDIPSQSTTVAYADDIKLVATENTPENLKCFADEKSVTLNWSDPAYDGGSYEIYKEGKLVKTVSGCCTYTDSSVSAGTASTYSVRKVSKNGISVAESVTAAYMPESLKNYESVDFSEESDVTASIFDGKAFLEWKGSREDYAVYKNSQLCSVAHGNFYIDSDYSAGDEYSIRAADHEKKELYLPSKAEIKVCRGEFNAEAVFTDADGKECPKNTYGTSEPRYISGRLDNYTGKAFTSDLILAFYDGGRLINTRIENVMINQGTQWLSLALDYGSGVTGDYSVRAFLWDDVNSVVPLTECLSTAFDNSNSDSDTTVEILPQTYQTITGWGLSPFSVAKQDFEAFKYIDDWKQMYDKIYGELGITTIRVPFDASCGDENGNVSSAALDLRVQYVKNAIEYGIDDYIISYWSPPSVWVERTEGEVSWTKYQYHLIAGHEQDYCNYIVECLKYMNDNGAGLPKGISFQNEPQDGASIPTYSKTQYIEMTKLLRKTLDDAGLGSVLIITPETASYYSQYRFMGGSAPGSGSSSYFNFDNLAEDSEYADSIGAFAIHSYYQTSIGARDADIANYALQTSKYPEKERWQTEFSGMGGSGEVLSNPDDDMSFDYDFGNALFTMRILASDVGWAGINRWYYWQAYRSHYNLTDDGYSYDVLNNKFGQQTIAFGQPGQRVYTGKLYEAFRILFNSVPVGSVVRRASCSDSSVANTSALKSDILAFETPSGTAVMFLNTSQSSRIVDFSGLSGNRATVSCISRENAETQSVERQITDGSLCKIHIPQKSITFIVTSN